MDTGSKSYEAGYIKGISEGHTEAQLIEDGYYYSYGSIKQYSLGTAMAGMGASLIIHTSKFKPFNYYVEQGGEGFGYSLYGVTNGKITSIPTSGNSVNYDYIMYNCSASGNSGGHGYLYVTK